MNLKCQMIMNEYHEQYDSFVKLGETVYAMIREALSENDIEVMAVEHRVKMADSLEGKLELKGDKYASLADITDILGARIITVFADDVDKISALIEQLFVIDKSNSVDKREALNPDSFGYLSVHYICSLAEDSGYPEELCGKKFEIQLRSVLQHTWAFINHDMGYKSEFGVPRAMRRSLSRLAGLLEIADEQFEQVRDGMRNYIETTRTKIIEDNAEDVLLDFISLREYVQHNRKMVAFLEDAGRKCGAEVSYIDPAPYVNLFAWFGIDTIGDIQKMFDRNRDMAMDIVVQTIADFELDIMSTSIGLRAITRAELVSGDYTAEQIKEFLMLGGANETRARRMSEKIVKSREKWNIK